MVCSSVNGDATHTVACFPSVLLFGSLTACHSFSRLASNPRSRLFTVKPATPVRLVWGYGALLPTNHRQDPVIWGFALPIEE